MAWLIGADKDGDEPGWKVPNEGMPVSCGIVAYCWLPGG